VILADDGARRLIAVYESPNAVALQLGKCLPFALAYVLLPLSSWRRGFGAICSVLMLMALVLTQSLGALLFGIPAMMAVMLLGWQGQRARLWLVGLGILGTISLLPLSRLIPRLRTALEGNNSTLFRLNVWRSTIELLKDHPITGVGLDQFLYIYRSSYIVPEGSADPDLSPPHNFILDYWVFLGIAGVLVGLWLQVAFWRTIWSTYRRVHHADPILFALLLGAMGMMANFIGHGLVDVSFFFINLSFLFSLVVAVVLRIHRLASIDAQDITP
jgi:O-antigen ligase